MKKILFFVFILLYTSFVFAQKMEMNEGQIKNIIGITEYNLVFDYSSIEIPKYESEETFLIEKMKMREDKKQGDGARFKKSWFDDRINRYEPKFIERFNKYFKKGDVKVFKNNINTPYIIKIKTTFIYPGYNVGVWRQDSKISATITVYKKDAPFKILFSANFLNAKGGGKETSGYDFNSGDRIAFAYGNLGKSFAKEIRLASKRKHR